MANNIMVLEGSAQWAKVFEPDTKFNPLGDFSINLQMTAAEAAPMCERLEQLVQAKFAEAVNRSVTARTTIKSQQ